MARHHFNGKLLRQMRKEAGLTQEQLAIRLQLSRETISAIENEHIGAIDKLSLETLKRWNRACGSGASRPTRETFAATIKAFLHIS